MALSVTSILGKDGARSWKIAGGLVLVHADLTVGDASVDYSSGLDLSGILAKIGLSAIFEVLACSIRAAADNSLSALVPGLDPTTGKLRFFKTHGPNPTEAVADTDLVDGDVLRLLVLGV